MYIASLHNDMCFYFHDYYTLPEAARNPHYLLNIIQFSHSQSGIKPIRVNVTRCGKMCIVHTPNFAHLEIHKNHIEWYTGLHICILYQQNEG